MAPITLVAAKVIPSKIIENNIVPKIPIIAVKIVGMLHKSSLLSVTIATNKPRVTVAMPNITQRKAGVKVMTAIYLNIPAITPITMLARTAKSRQLYLLRGQSFVILSPPITLYEDLSVRVTFSLILIDKL